MSGPALEADGGSQSAAPVSASGRASPDQPIRARKTRDAALLLPLAGLALLMPPIANVFAVDARLGSVPVVAAYVFAVWFGLILLAWRLARRLGG
ncbi:MAG: hypothetical protein ACFBRM_12245 [Pikeienuella sp.]